MCRDRRWNAYGKQGNAALPLPALYAERQHLCLEKHTHVQYN